MCRKIESVTIFRIIKSIDKDAFITQAQVNGVYGRGSMKSNLNDQTPHTRRAPDTELPTRPEPKSFNI